MAKKLTLSLPEATVRKAKIQARKRGTSVSALFARSIEQLEAQDDTVSQILKEFPDLQPLIGAGGKLEAFDARSARILEKHG